MKLSNAQTDTKIKRDAFLYLDPKEPKDSFAQCSSCIMFTGKTCHIHSKNDKVDGDDSCGFYLNGKPRPELAGKELGIVTAKESGLQGGQVRCENCTYFGDAECTLFKLLNKTLPDIFFLEQKVAHYGCCNAFRSKS